MVIGPPLSPLHESLPDAAAQNMLFVMAEVPYSDRHVVRDTTGTETYLKDDGRVEPPSDVSPHPDTVVLTPAAGSEP
jgi:hypothetical protein